MSLVFSASPAAILSLLIDNMENTNGDANGKQDFDTLQLRNRTVTETLSPVEDLGQNKKVLFDSCCQRFDNKLCLIRKKMVRSKIRRSMIL